MWVRIFVVLATNGLAHAYTMVNSGYIMRKNIDSIVQPGKYTSHMHSFFGNDAVNATTSTTEELMSGCATNSNPNDLSVYWHPTLYANNGTELVPIEARYFKAYYNSIDTAEIPFPTDFKAIAGNVKATTAEDVDDLLGMSWWCEYGPETSPDANGWPNAGCNLGRLQTQLLFPDCVNPDTLASGYSSRAWLSNMNRCPDGMKRIPQLRFSVRFDTSAVLPDGWAGQAPLQLSSGNAYSWHGDFINGWLPEAAANMMLATDKRAFQVVEGPRSELATCTPVDSDPDNGTSDYEESLLLIAAAASNEVVNASLTSVTNGATASSANAVGTPTFSTAIHTSPTPSQAPFSTATPTETEIGELSTPPAAGMDNTQNSSSSQTHPPTRPQHCAHKHGSSRRRPHL